MTVGNAASHHLFEMAALRLLQELGGLLRQSGALQQWPVTGVMVRVDPCVKGEGHGSPFPLLHHPGGMGVQGSSVVFSIWGIYFCR